MQRLPTIQYDERIAMHGDPDLLTILKEAVLPFRVCNPGIHVFECQIKGLLRRCLLSSRSYPLESPLRSSSSANTSQPRFICSS